MSLYAFTLDTLHVLVHRGKLQDEDVLTFSVMINNIERGRGAGLFPDLSDNTIEPTSVVPMSARKGSATANWVIGPFELQPYDTVDIIYTVINTSDSQLSNQDAEKFELKVLDEILTTAVGSIGGGIGAALGAALGGITDPVAKFLGWEPRGPCNGLVLSDSVPFTGGSLADLEYEDLSDHHEFPGASAVSFTRPYTDVANHDTSICGEVARSEITFTVLKVPDLISVQDFARRRDLSIKSLASWGVGARPVGLKSLMGVLP
jgi:hypothetical protein